MPAVITLLSMYENGHFQHNFHKLSLYAETPIFTWCVPIYSCLYILEQLTVQHGLKCGSFMPFVSECRSREYKQLVIQSKFSQFKVPEAFPDHNQSHLIDLLCNRLFDDKQPNEWMKAVEHCLWGSDILPEVGATRITDWCYLKTSTL